MTTRRSAPWAILAAALVGALLLGCSGPQGNEVSTPDQTEEQGSSEFPAKDPGQPFALSEKGTVTLTNQVAYNIVVQGENGESLFEFSSKVGATVEPSVRFAVQAFEQPVPEELAAKYVAIGSFAMQMHVAGETGYGFALRPTIKIHFTDDEIAAAKQAGASLEALKGNLIVLYKEQRSPQWVPQTSVSVDQDAKMVTVTNVAGSGAWRLVAKKAP